MNETTNDTDYSKDDYHSRFDRAVYSDRILTVPNALTLSRLVGLPFLIWFLHKMGQLGPIPVVALGSYMVLSDILDGVLAKALHQTSLVGAIMDPVVDKLIINTVAVFLVYRGWLPLWAIVIIVFRDLAILIFGLRIFINYGMLVTPVLWGRFTPLLWGAVFVAATMELEIFKWILLPLAIILTLISGILYYHRYEDLLQMKNKGG